MIRFLTESDLGVVRTDKQFVIIIHNKIYGPFENELVDTILNLLKQEEN